MSFRTIISFLSVPYTLLLVFFLFVYLWKISSVFWINGLSDHLSNFALTGLGALVFIGPIAFSRKKFIWYVVTITGFFIAANVLVEGLAAGSLNGFNVVDGYDGLFGIVAALIVFLGHFYISRRVPERE